jgi:hypothetical protein
MRYGKTVSVSRDGEIVTVEEQVFANWSTVKKVTLYTEVVRVKDDKEILTEFLKLLDRRRAGEVDLIGIQCIRDKANGSLRIEKSWTVSDL